MVKTVLYSITGLLAVVPAAQADSLEGAFVEALKQVPALAVLASLIYFGLRYFERRDTSDRLDRESRDKVLSSMHEETIDAIKTNTAGLTQVLDSCQTCRESHRDIETLLRHPK